MPSFQSLMPGIDNSNILPNFLVLKLLETEISKTGEYFGTLIPMMLFLAEIATIKYSIQFSPNKKVILKQMIQLLELAISRTLFLKLLPRDKVED